MTPTLLIILTVCVTLIVLGGLCVAGYAVDRSVRLAADAQRILASRDYREFASAKVVEERAGQQPRELTAEEMEAAEERRLWQAGQNDPFSVA